MHILLFLFYFLFPNKIGQSHVPQSTLYLELKNNVISDEEFQSLKFSLSNQFNQPYWLSKRIIDGNYDVFRQEQITGFPVKGTLGIYLEIIDEKGKSVKYPCFFLRSGRMPCIVHIDFGVNSLVAIEAESKKIFYAQYGMDYFDFSYEYSRRTNNDFINMMDSLTAQANSQKKTNYTTEQIEKEYALKKYFSLVEPNSIANFDSVVFRDIRGDFEEIKEYIRRNNKSKKYYARLVLKQDSAEVRKKFLSGSISEKEFPDAKIFHGTLYSNKVPLVFKKDK